MRKSRGRKRSKKKPKPHKERRMTTSMKSKKLMKEKRIYKKAKT